MLKTVKTAAIAAALLLTAMLGMSNVASACDPLYDVYGCAPQHRTETPAPSWTPKPPPDPNDYISRPDPNRRYEHDRYMDRQDERWERDNDSYCRRGYRSDC